MATTFTGLRVQDTYNAILKIGDNSNLSGTAKILSDGVGNSSSIYLSTTRFGIGITPAYQFHTSGNAKIGGNLIISGNLTVNGTLTYLNVEDLAVEDPLIKLAKDNTANTLDIGFFGKYVATGTKYKGLFNDASDDKFKLFIGTSTEPTTTVDTTASGYTMGTLVANIEGGTGTFTGLVSGIAPTSDLNFATKKYVDDQTIPTPTLSSVLSAGNSSGANDLKIIDDQKLLLGDDGDMQIYHNQVNSVFFNDTGNIVFRNNANDSDISFQTDDGQGYTTEYLRLDGDDVNVVFSKPISGTTASFSGLVTGIAPTSDLNFATKKYVDDQTVPTPTLSSVLGTGNTSGANDIIMADDQKVFFGTDSDLKIFHNGTASFINNYTGDLNIANYADDKNIRFYNDNGIGGVTEYFRIDGNINRNVISVTTQLNDNVPIIFGDGSGRPNIKYDSTASQLFIGGESKFLDDLYVGGTLTMNGNTINMVNGAINNVNNLSFNDPGGDEGISWLSGNLWKIYESPNDFSNAAGNLQFVKDTTRSMTLDTSGNLYILGGANINGETTIKSNDGLVLYTETSEASLKPKITFSTLPDNPVQFGVIEYTHLDSLSQGGGHSFSFVGEDDANDNLVIMAGDGTKTGTYLSTSRGSTNHADFGFYGDINTGMYRPADHVLGFLANGSRKINISSTTVAIQNATLTAGAINASASITATGNSNSFGNTTIGALSASSGTFSASVTAAGNSNSFGTTTITNLTTTTSFSATNSIVVNSTGTSGLYLRGDSNNTGDSGQLDSVIEMTHDSNLYGMELGSYNFSGWTEFALKQLSTNGSGGFDKATIFRTSLNNDLNVGGLTKDGSTVWRRLGAGISASMLSRETGSADAIFSNNLYIGSDDVDKRLVAGGVARIFMNDDITRFQYSGTSTADSGISWTESMRINNNGRVGIGSISPGQKLHLREPGATSVYMQWGNNSDLKNSYAGLSAGGRFNLQTNDEIAFYTGASYTERMRLTSSGLLGIGTDATDPTELLTIDQSGGSIDLRGGNNRIYFTGKRALEGNAAGTVLQIGESYSETFMYGQVGINCNPAERLHVLGKVRFDGYSLTDPDTTSTSNYPADVMLTHYNSANGVSIIGGQGGYTGCGLTIGEETGRATNFKYIRGVSDTNGSPAEEFYVNGLGGGYFRDSIGVGIAPQSGELKILASGTSDIWIGSYSTNGGVNGFRTQTSSGSRQNTLYRNATSNLVTLRAGTDDGQIQFIAGGSTAEAMRIDTAQRVGINVTNPTEKLHVEGRIRLGTTPVICSHDNIGIDIDQNNNSGGNYFRVTRDGEATELFRVQENNNVGINDQNPGYRLDITGSGMRIKDTGDVQIIVNADTDNSDETHSPVMRFLQDGTHNMLNVGSNGTSGTPDFTGLLDNAAYVMGGTGHGGTVPLQFGTGGIAFMIIEKSGSLPQIGIGTTNPAATLEINTNGGFEGSLRLDGTGNTSRGILIRNVGTAEGGIKTDGNFTINIEDANRTMRFKTANTERMSIDSGGIINVPSGARIDMGPGTWKNGSYSGNPIGTLNVEKAAGNPIQMFNTQEGFQFLAFIDSQSSGSQISTIGWSSGSGNPFKITNMGNTAIYITSAGYVGIKKTSGISYALDVTGSIRATSDVIAFSDRRVKENIATVDNALDKVTKLRGVKYTRKDINDKSTKVGVIAQEILEVLPEVVEKDDQGMYSVAYGNMAGVFIEAIKELKAEVDSLKKEIKQLKK
jgi:hypothetical protein